MKTIRNTFLLGLVALAAFAQQNTILATTLSAAVTAQATQIRVASASGINAPSFANGQAGSLLFIQDRGQTMGETVQVTGISGTTVSVSRTGTVRAHTSGAMVLVATNANWFYTVDPVGSCVTAQTYVVPWLNITNGNQWKCSSSTLSWVPSWGTPAPAQLLTNTLYTMVAGASVIGGPLIATDTGTNATTSFTMSAGWNGQGFCVIPGGAFTVTASNNIEKAATAVADRTLCFTWNSKLAAFAPSY